MRTFDSIFCVDGGASALQQRVWVTARLAGGLGNQLFMAAAAAAYAYRENACIFLAASTFSQRDAGLRDSPMLARFPRTMPTSSSKPTMHVVAVPLFVAEALPGVASIVGLSHRELTTTAQVIELQGYAQNAAYFDAVSAGVRHLLQPPAEAAALLERAFPALRDAVGIHMRFGDKSDLPLLYPQLRDQYYAAAYALITATVLPPRDVFRVYVATDDEQAARRSDFLRSLKIPLTFLPDDPTTALWALSLCGRGIITASSTFSWWAAYLRHDEHTPVAMPRSVFLPQEPDYPGGYFPSSFFVLDVNGTLL